MSSVGSDTQTHRHADTQAHRHTDTGGHLDTDTWTQTAHSTEHKHTAHNNTHAHSTRTHRTSHTTRHAQHPLSTAHNTRRTIHNIQHTAYRHTAHNKHNTSAHTTRAHTPSQREAILACFPCAYEARRESVHCAELSDDFRTSFINAFSSRSIDIDIRSLTYMVCFCSLFGRSCFNNIFDKLTGPFSAGTAGPSQPACLSFAEKGTISKYSSPKPSQSNA